MRALLSNLSGAQKALLCFAAILTALCSGFVIYGAADLHTPVPWGDSWDGLVQFYMNAQDGQAAAWWGQHNEHRFVISRVLYWLDYTVFGGALVSLFLWNFLFAGLGVLLFIKLARIAVEKAGGIGATANFVGLLTALFLMAWLYLWTQYETLAYAFNPHFFLAYVMPLWAFYLLYEARESGRGKTFALACVIGVLSAGSMANAIATLPFMALYAAVMQMSAKRIGFLAVLSAVVIAVYMWGFQSVGGHGSVVQSTLTDPVGMMHFVLNYMGGPFFFFAAGVPAGPFVAPVFGAFFIGSCAVFAWQSIRARAASAFPIMLLVFILYIGASAFATAGGRLPMGTGAAFAPRYTTSTVMAWAALLLLYMPLIFSLMKTKTGQRLVTAGFIAAFTVVTLMQSTVFMEKRDWAKGRAIGGLAAEMQVRDDVYLKKIYGNPGKVLRISKEASVRNIGFFGRDDYRNVRETIGTKAPPAPRACDAMIHGGADLPGDKNFARVYGAFSSQSSYVPSAVYIVSDTGDIVGYGLTNMERALPDRPSTGSQKFWFTAYIKAEKYGGDLYLQDTKGKCRTDKINYPLK